MLISTYLLRIITQKMKRIFFFQTRLLIGFQIAFDNSEVDNSFDGIIGCIEDIVIGEDFQEIQVELLWKRLLGEKLVFVVKTTFKKFRLSFLKKITLWKTCFCCKDDLEEMLKKFVVVVVDVDVVVTTKFKASFWGHYFETTW